MGQDDAAILWADISALPILGGGIMDGKKDVEHIPEGNHVWIISNLNHFCMAGARAASLLISRVRNMHG